MSVTRQIRRTNLKYGASENTNPNSYVASKSLNLSKGPSITRPDNLDISVIPYALNYKDTVGLFGTENYYLKVNLNVIGDIVKETFEELNWNAAEIETRVVDNTPSYLGADIDYVTVEADNNWTGAELNLGSLAPAGDEDYLSVEIINNGTGNIYVDKHVDVRLYTIDKQEHPYDLMYISRFDHFYIGVHARNTRTLPYDFELRVGREFKNISLIDDKRYIMKAEGRFSY